jgi:hypothetical protein
LGLFISEKPDDSDPYGQNKYQLLQNVKTSDYESLAQSRDILTCDNEVYADRIKSADNRVAIADIEQAELNHKKETPVHLKKPVNRVTRVWGKKNFYE